MQTLLSRSTIYSLSGRSGCYPDDDLVKNEKDSGRTIHVTYSIQRFIWTSDLLWKPEYLKYPVNRETKFLEYCVLPKNPRHLVLLANALISDFLKMYVIQYHVYPWVSVDQNSSSCQISNRMCL